MREETHNNTEAVFGEVRTSTVEGFAGSVIPIGGVVWEGYSHRKMWDMIMRANPDELFERVRQWHDVASRLAESNKIIQQRLNALLLSWQGPAAEAAAASQQRLLNWAQDAMTRASTVGTQLGNYGNALVSARQRMPQPQHRAAELNFRHDEGVTVLEGTAGAHMLLQMLSDRLPTAQQAREAKHDAVQIMRELEGNAVKAERAMPQFNDAPKTTKPGQPNPVQPRPWREPGPRAPYHDPVSGSGWSIGDADSSFDGTASVGTSAAQAVSAPVGYGPGEIRGASPLGGAGGGQMGVIDRGTPAGPGTFGASASGGLAARTAPAGPGGGFLPAAVGGRSDGGEDTEKPLADYLEGDGLFTDDRPVAPPVLGI
jgi:hypothetical protein